MTYHDPLLKRKTYLVRGLTLVTGGELGQYHRRPVVRGLCHHLRHHIHLRRPQIATEVHVVDTDGLPIPGLYAAGELVGGLFYFNYPGGTGLMSGSVFGRAAGAAAGRAATG